MLNVGACPWNKFDNTFFPFDASWGKLMASIFEVKDIFFPFFSVIIYYMLGEHIM